MYTDQYIDLNAHQKLMDKMNEVVDKASGMLTKAQEVRQELTDHNTDANAHPDIRSAILEVNTGNETLIDLRVTQHDENENAHLTQFAAIKALIADTSITKQLLGESIEEHNVSPTAHVDIREQLNKISNQIGSTYIADITNNISNINSQLSDINEDIIALQSVDARHDSEILKNSKDIETLNKELAIHEFDILDIGHKAADYSERADRCHLQTIELKIAHELGYTLYTEGGPSLLDFECSLPVYVGRNTTKEFTLSGAGDNVTYEIIPGKGPVVFSKQTDITNDEELTLQVQSAAKYGELCYFTVIATGPGTSYGSYTNASSSSGSNLQVQRIVAFYVTTPIDPDEVTLKNLPENVEPEAAYTFHFRNLVEGNERYTYSINPGVSGLLFNKTEDLDEDEDVVMTVPSSAIRGQDVEFEVIIHDIYGNDVYKKVTLHINELPGLEGFETNLPTVVAPNSSFTVKFAGITSIDGTPVKYKISDASEYLTFSKLDNILTNENVTVSVTNSAPRGDRATFTLTTIDENQVSFTMPLGFQINQLPESESIDTDFISETEGGITTTLIIAGGSDPEDAAHLTYSIADVNSGFNFSKTENIEPYEDITVKIPKVAADGTFTFNIYAVDSLGEKSDAKVVTTTVKAIHVINTPEVLYPEPGITTSAAFTARFSQYSTHVDLV